MLVYIVGGLVVLKVMCRGLCGGDVVVGRFSVSRGRVSWSWVFISS